MMFLGFMQMYDLAFPDDVPHVTNLGCNSEVVHLVNQRDHSWRTMRQDPTDNWKALQPSIAILRKVCPEAADWAEDRWSTGNLVFEAANSDNIAHYDFISKKLTLNWYMRDCTHGENAVTLAHEFRHSRQQWTRPARAAIYILIFQKVREEIVEDEAHDFERQVHIAIYEK